MISEWDCDAADLGPFGVCWIGGAGGICLGRGFADGQPGQPDDKGRTVDQR